MTTAFDGLTALASLDGAPFDPRDLATLGLPVGASGFAVVARDRGTTTTATFLGHLDDPAALAAALGLDRATPPPVLLRAAIAWYGDDAAIHAPGEWSFLDWDAQSATLTLMVSETMRDNLLYTTDGRRVAVAPHVRTLRYLRGIDSALDGAGVLLHMGRAALRGALGNRTILRDTYTVTAGTRVRITADGVTIGRRADFPAPVRWRGSFEEAIDALDAVWRQILREQMARDPNASVMLSGGLDSSLIAVYAAAERGAGTLLAVSSAAPPGSALLDEVEFAQAVADQAGIPLLPVVPGADADVYRPSPGHLHWMQHLIASPRHYVYDALYAAAAGHGASAMLDGVEGESTLTGYADDGGWRWHARQLIDRVRGAPRAGTVTSVADAFHVRASAHALSVATRQLREELRVPLPQHLVHRRGDVWGYPYDLTKALVATTTSHVPGLRRLLPFRDRRLVTLFAGMPYRFITHGGVTRAPARALLTGKVPEHIRLRDHGRPFSPDFLDRIRDQAAHARTRLPELVAGGADEWLDLAWLDGALGRIAGGTTVSLDTVFEVQTTATAAAFLADWAAGSAPEA